MKNTQEKPGEFIRLSEGQALPPRSSWECDPKVIALEALTEALKQVTKAQRNGIAEGFDATEPLQQAIAILAEQIANETNA